MEAGNSWMNVNQFNPFEVKRSFRLGLRIFMPMFGILGVDFGHGFDKYSGYIKVVGKHILLLVNNFNLLHLSIQFLKYEKFNSCF